MRRTLDRRDRTMEARAWTIGLAVMLGLAPAAARAQDMNFPRPASEIERQLQSDDFEVLRIVPSRAYNTDRTFQITATLEDGNVIQMKFAPAPEGGTDFNNRPSYELAPYELQKLFLDESEYVVPPTVARAFPLDWVQDLIAQAPGTPNPVEQTFDEWRVSLAVLQYWLPAVLVATNDMIDDEAKFESDPVFARNAANFNLLTYLIRHNDSNEGNYLIAMDQANPRIFSVDNGVAFASQESDRGHYFRDLVFDRFPASSIDRLRQVDLETLKRELGVLVQLELRGGAFVAVEPTDNLDPGDSIRTTDSVIQIGLREGEIEAVYRRLERLIERVDEGGLATF